MLTVILNALGDFVQFSDGKDSKFLWFKVKFKLVESVNLYKVFLWRAVIYLFIFAMCNLMIGEPKNMPPTKMLEVFKQQFEKTSCPALETKYSQPDLSTCLALFQFSVSLQPGTQQQLNFMAYQKHHCLQLLLPLQSFTY